MQKYWIVALLAVLFGWPVSAGANGWNDEEGDEDGTHQVIANDHDGEDEGDDHLGLNDDEDEGDDHLGLNDDEDGGHDGE